MEWMTGCPGAALEPLPDWDLYLVDAFGRPAHLVGGVLGVAATAEDAADVFVRANPEFEGVRVFVVRSSIVPPWAAHGGA